MDGMGWVRSARTSEIPYQQSQMIRLFNHYLRRQTVLQVMLDMALLVVVITGFFLLSSGHGAEPGAPGDAAAYGFSLAMCLLLINTASGLYEPARGRSLTESCARATLALLIALPLAYLIFGLLPSSVAREQELRWIAMASVAIVIGHRVYAAHATGSRRPRSRILIFGSGASAEQVGDALRVADPRAQVVGYYAGPNETERVVADREMVGQSGSLKQCANELHVHEIVVALSERRGGSMPLGELLDCKVSGIRVSDLSTYFEKMLGQIRIDHVRAGWLIFGDGFHQDAFRTIVKRFFDLACAAALLVVTLPLMLITAVAVALESSGPVLYRQQRVGRDGRVFEVLKFRSMRRDAEHDGRPKWAASGDDRVTSVGTVIRRFRIDELPQLFNVLMGDMSLVGPRPERPFFVDRLLDKTPYYALRHSVKPGLTGWAQVRFQYGATIEDSLEKLQYDLYYVKNHSLFLDLVIVFETIGVVLSGKGAR
jgi:sugar transferase (PEP-CTERM system associated)